MVHLRLWDDLSLLDRPYDEVVTSHEREVEVWVNVLRNEGLLSPVDAPTPTQITVAMQVDVARPAGCSAYRSWTGGRPEHPETSRGRIREYPNWRVP